MLQALAGRFNVEEVADLHFQALLLPLDKQCLQANGTVRGRVRQICGVTLEPLWTDIEQNFSTEFQPQELVAKYIVPEDDFDTELPEAMQNGQADIGEMVTQLFAMEIPAYPRIEGAANSPDMGKVRLKLKPKMPSNRPLRPCRHLSRLMAMLDKILKQAHIERRFGIVSIGSEGTCD